MTNFQFADLNDSPRTCAHARNSISGKGSPVSLHRPSSHTNSLTRLLRAPRFADTGERQIYDDLGAISKTQQLYVYRMINSESCKIADTGERHISDDLGAIIKTQQFCTSLYYIRAFCLNPGADGSRGTFLRNMRFRHNCEHSRAKWQSCHCGYNRPGFSDETGRFNRSSVDLITPRGVRQPEHLQIEGGITTFLAS